MKNENTMKRVATILLFVLMLSISVSGQVFMTDNEFDNRLGYTESEGVIVPMSGGLQNDQTNYTPIGTGSMLLTVLGGAYLLCKRRKRVSHM